MCFFRKKLKVLRTQVTHTVSVFSRFSKQNEDEDCLGVLYFSQACTQLPVTFFFLVPVFSLQDLCCRSIVSCTPVHLIDKLPLPVAIKSHLKSFSMANGMNAVMMHGRSHFVINSTASGSGSGGSKASSLKRSVSFRPPQSPPKYSSSSKGNCKIS